MRDSVLVSFFKTVYALMNNVQVAPRGKVLRGRLHKSQRYTFPVIFAVLELLLNTYLFNIRPTLELRLEMSSSIASTAQLFYDIGRGYNERDSKQIHVAASAAEFYQPLSFDLPKTNILALRFDPITTAGRFKIREAQVRAGFRALERFSANDLLPFNQIQTRRTAGRVADFSTIQDANDPGIAIFLHGELDYAREARRWRRWALKIANAFTLALAILVLLTRDRIISCLQLIKLVFKRVHATFGRVADTVQNPDFIRLDAAAIWVYATCVLVFAIATAADLNGSCISMFSNDFGHGAAEKPLIGQTHIIRSDEWEFHTPNIINECLRADRFGFRDTAIGPDSIALLANVPVRDVSTFFRPEFWPFFFLRVDYAYAAYWQFKALLLITGVFTWLLLVTQSTMWAAVGSLWFFFSPCTQWDYSWASLLPEMTGSVCFAITCACFLTVGKRPITLSLAALGLATFGVNFAMCAYIPHLIPFVWLAVFFFGSWCIYERRAIFVRDGAPARLAAALAAVLIISVVGLIVYSEAHVALRGIANTIYPGQRVSPPGTTPVQYFLSQFFGWSESQYHFPAPLVNICEAAGFIWLAPVSLFCFPRITLMRKVAFYTGLCCFMLLLLAWLLLPLTVPMKLADFTGLDKTYGTRAVPALGLANVAIVALTASCRRQPNQRAARRWAAIALRSLGTLLVVTALLSVTDTLFGSVFTWRELLLAICLLTIFSILLLEGYTRSFAVGLVFASILAFGLVNPIQRGLGVITSSAMYEFVKTHPETKRGKWIVYKRTDESMDVSSFMTAVGCEVYTGLRYLPDIDHFAIYAAHGINVNYLNQAGWLVARPLASGRKAFVEQPGMGITRLNVAPDDGLLKDLGIRYVAFENKPGEEVGANLIRLADNPIDGFWIYRLP